MDTTEKIAPLLSTAVDPLIEWNEKFTVRVVVLSIVTAVLAASVVLMFAFGNLKEIAENFPRYRCSPMFMPFAAQFGYDTKENFDFCLTNVFNKKAAEVFTPIYGLLGGFTGVISLLVDTMLGLRKLLSNFLLSVNGFIRNVRDRIQNLLFQIRISYLKMNNIMGRLYATMYSIIWLGTSALAAGFNIADNDLVQFLFSFCFDPYTRVRRADGSEAYMKDLVIGDVIQSDGVPVRVTSTFVFNGLLTPLVKINGITVSRNHYIHDNGKWMPAGDHPNAIPVPSLREIVCINVESNTFSVFSDTCPDGMLVSDYDEHSCAHVIRDTQRLALHALNGQADNSAAVGDYSLGISSNFEVHMADGSWKTVGELKLGDKIWNNGVIQGIVQEECESSVSLGNSAYISVSQTVYNPSLSSWKRAGQVWSTVSNTPRVLHSFFTEHCGTIEIRHGGSVYFIRDYREVALSEMESAYTNKFREAL